MELTNQIDMFITSPFPLWETTLTKRLIEHKWPELQKYGLNSRIDYSTARTWFQTTELEITPKLQVLRNDVNNVYLEIPSFHILQSFYDEHGLEMLTKNEIDSNEACKKIKKAISILEFIKPAYDCIVRLVWSIQVLRQPDPDTDLSYSHPQIPFSIFISVCDDDSESSNLRIAESILHEAMHLKLTLLETVTPLIKPNTKSLYFSPWRNEYRPVGGILHGLFVFRAIYEFYLTIATSYKDTNIENIVNYRLYSLRSEISSLTEFYKHNDLSERGRALVSKLIEC